MLDALSTGRLGSVTVLNDSLNVTFDYANSDCDIVIVDIGTSAWTVLNSYLEANGKLIQSLGFVGNYIRTRQPSKYIFAGDVNAHCHGSLLRLMIGVYSFPLALGFEHM